MHFEILVEDSSGRAALDVLLRKILPREHTWRTTPYKGLGRIPKNLRPGQDPAKRQLLAQLPRLLRGYGKSLWPDSALIVVVDLDTRDCLQFKQELLDVLNSCDPRPTALFRIAIEESEAWLLGDRSAVLAAYPSAKAAVLDSYVPDSICGTWEVLADAVQRGGSRALKNASWQVIGAAKHEWASQIAPHVDVDRNRSTSFQTFRRGLQRLAGVPTAT